MLKLFKPFVSPEAITNAVRVLRSSQLAEGEEVKKFEHELEQKLGVKHIVTLNSGSSALALAYELAGITEGDEVITPVLTCTATNIPLLHLKAKIVFADIDYDLNINIEDVKRKITNKTKAIVFVHFGGNNRGLNELLELCKKKRILLIEDAAQAITSDFWGKADFTAVSLQAIKLITSGDGGLLLTRTQEDYEKAKRLRWFGIDRPRKQKEGDVNVTEAGYKYHMNDIAAAIGRGNLMHFDRLKSHIFKLHDKYKDYGLFTHPWLAGFFTDRYDEAKAELAKAGFESGQHHYRNDKYTIFKKFKTVCPIMDELEHKYIFVPLHRGVNMNQAREIGKIAQKYAKL